MGRTGTGCRSSGGGPLAICAAALAEAAPSPVCDESTLALSASESQEPARCGESCGSAAAAAWRGGLRGLCNVAALDVAADAGAGPAGGAGLARLEADNDSKDVDPAASAEPGKRAPLRGEAGRPEELRPVAPRPEADSDIDAPWAGVGRAAAVPMPHSCLI